MQQLYILRYHIFLVVPLCLHLPLFSHHYWSLLILRPWHKLAWVFYCKYKTTLIDIFLNDPDASLPGCPTLSMLSPEDVCNMLIPPHSCPLTPSITFLWLCILPAATHSHSVTQPKGAACHLQAHLPLPSCVHAIFLEDSPATSLMSCKNPLRAMCPSCSHLGKFAGESYLPYVMPS